MSKFHIIVIGILMALAVIAVLFLSGVLPALHGPVPAAAPIQLKAWGDIPIDYLRNTITILNEQNKTVFNLDYIQKDSANYENELLEALATGRGPDIWVVSQDSILKNKDKILIVPFSSFSERTFKDSFIQEGELFLSSSGIIAFPFIVDPIVLYWNRDLFSNAGISSPPKFWDEFVNFVKKLTIRDSSNNITQAGAALGEYQNIGHAKELISLLILQTGNPIVNPQTLKPALMEQGVSAINPAENAIQFFTQFSNSVKTTYSWNRSLPNSKNAFIAGTLAMYFGYAGEYKDIAGKNPHLNFDVAGVPQIKDGPIQATFARMYGLAISKLSSNAATAVTAVYALTAKDSISGISKAAYLPPVRRDILAENVQDSALAVFYKSAIQSRAWLEPDSNEVSNIFKDMIEGVITGKRKISEIIRAVNDKLGILLGKLKT